jgi:predicted nuclease of predicted toxin-antitoxin system
VATQLLFDENLSQQLIELVADVYPHSAHVGGAGLSRASDEAIWAYAAANAFIIVTKDDDFRQRSFLRGHPPKVIWLRFGNCSTTVIASALRDRAADVLAFAVDPTSALLVLSRLA